MCYTAPVWNLRAPHSFRVSPEEAVAIQKKLAALVEIRKPEKDLRFIAGVDAAFPSDGRCALGGVVVWDPDSARVVESHTAEAELPMPYIPGLLSFRELPAVIAALRKLSRKPDAVMCDGQGIAHPHRMDLETAEELVLRCGGGYRLPEPIRRAHRLVTESKRERDR